MLTRLKLTRGEGQLVEPSSQLSRRRTTIQRIKDDETKIQLASLRLESATLIWWEAKTQEDMKKHGKVLSSLNDFIVSLRRQFYPLAYM
jgi:hypothetical protein